MTEAESSSSAGFNGATAIRQLLGLLYLRYDAISLLMVYVCGRYFRSTAVLTIDGGGDILVSIGSVSLLDFGVT